MGDTLEVLRKRIKNARVGQGLTLKDVANYLGIKEATAQRYESGEIKNIPYDNIVLMAKLFQCSPQYLMGWEQSNNIYWNTLKEKQMSFLSFIHKFCDYEAVYQVNSNYVHITLHKKPNELYKIDTNSYDNFIELMQKRIEFEFNNMIDNAEKIQKFEMETGELNAAYKIPGATEEEKQHDEDIMNDENF